jgi:hypothetical protein
MLTAAALRPTLALTAALAMLSALPPPAAPFTLTVVSDAVVAVLMAITLRLLTVAAMLTPAFLAALASAFLAAFALAFLAALALALLAAFASALFATFFAALTLMLLVALFAFVGLIARDRGTFARNSGLGAGRGLGRRTSGSLVRGGLIARDCRTFAGNGGLRAGRRLRGRPAFGFFLSAKRCRGSQRKSEDEQREFHTRPPGPV